MWDALYDLVPNCTSLTLLCGCFSRFFKCTLGIKLCKASRVIIPEKGFFLLCKFAKWNVFFSFFTGLLKHTDKKVWKCKILLNFLLGTFGGLWRRVLLKKHFQHDQAFGDLIVVKLHAQKNKFWELYYVLWLLLIFTYTLGVEKEKNRNILILHFFLKTKWATILRDAVTSFNKNLKDIFLFLFGLLCRILFLKKV